MVVYIYLYILLIHLAISLSVNILLRPALSTLIRLLISVSLSRLTPRYASSLSSKFWSAAESLEFFHKRWWCFLSISIVQYSFFKTLIDKVINGKGHEYLRYLLELYKTNRSLHSVSPYVITWRSPELSLWLLEIDSQRKVINYGAYFPLK